jgi:hypothetical protein
VVSLAIPILQRLPLTRIWTSAAGAIYEIARSAVPPSSGLIAEDSRLYSRPGSGFATGTSQDATGRSPDAASVMAPSRLEVS